eukprot:71932-Pelagomonas_calceolata.AAC.1
MAAQQRIKEFVHEHNLRSRPHALIWLSKVYGIPAGMCVCQVWGTEYLREGSEFKSHEQATAKLFNDMLVSNSETLCQLGVLKA